MPLAVDHVFICVDATSGGFHDFRPTVPLVLRW
jgi:hypothetical protein